jgi:O-antigen/teichoic acid export membrane protein
MSVKRNFIFNFLLTGSNLLFPLLTFPYLSRIIGAEGLGISNFILSYCQNFIIISALGLPVYGVREIARAGDDKLKRSKLFLELLFMHLIFTVFLLIIYCISLFLYADFNNFRLLTLFGGIFILINVFTIEWLFSGVSDFKYITIRSLVVRTLSVLAIFLFVKHKEDFTLYFVIIVVTFLLTSLININYARKYISRNCDFKLAKVFLHAKPVAILGIYMVLTNIYTLLPTTLLGFYSSKVAVGYFYGADKIIRMTVTVFTALTTVMVPKLNLIAERKESNDYLLLINKSLSFIISLGIPITFLIFLLAEPLIMLLAGKDFVNSIFCIQIMSPIILIIAFAQVFVIMILSVNRRDKEMVIISATGMTISLIINIIFIPYFAERATAFSQLITELLVTVFSFLMAKRFLNFQFPSKLFLVNLLCVVPFSLITYFWIRITDNIILELLLSGFSCGLYFLFYQFIIIKDKLLLDFFKPYFNKFGKLI